MKTTEEQREYLHSSLSNAVAALKSIQARGPLNCLPEFEKLCREMLPVLDEINVVPEQQTE